MTDPDSTEPEGVDEDQAETTEAPADADADE
jgi:hypothetical protein